MNTYLLRRRPSLPPAAPILVIAAACPLGEAEPFLPATMRALVAAEFHLLEPCIEDTNTVVPTKLYAKDLEKERNYKEASKSIVNLSSSIATGYS